VIKRAWIAAWAIAELGIAAGPALPVERTRVDAVLFRAIPAGGPGCAVSVTRDGVVVYEGARGLADLDYGLPLSSQSVLYVASNSKQFTAFAIALLIDRGVVKLNDPVTKWIPELPESVYGTVTIGDLIHHTGGVRDYWGLRDLQGQPSTAPLDQSIFLQLIAAQSALNFPAGSRFEYSNSGYALLALVVERASGETLARFADREIFAPLGMEHTSYGADHLLPLPGRAAGYEFDGNYRLDPSSVEPLGDGGVRTTAADLIRWLQNFQSNRLGSDPKSVMRLVQSPGQLNDGERVHYAFGFGISARDGYAMFDHTGSYAGYESFVAWLPDPRLGVAVLCNADGAVFSAWGVGLNVLDLFLGHDPSPPPSPSAASVTPAPAQLAKLTGTYTEPDGTVWQILEGDGVRARVQGLTFALQPIDQTHLRAVGAPQPVEIVIENSGLALKVGNGPVSQLKPFTPPAMTPAEIESYGGTYYSRELNLTLRVYGASGKLYLARDLESPQVLEPVRRDEFAIGPRTLKFERAARGGISAIVLSAPGVDELRVPRV
jgi:CubicO group peptidase (beta-lactamase class C family)